MVIVVLISAAVFPVVKLIFLRECFIVPGGHIWGKSEQNDNSTFCEFTFPSRCEMAASKFVHSNHPGRIISITAFSRAFQITY